MTDLSSATSTDGAIEVVFLSQIGDDPYHPNPERDAQALAVAGKLVTFVAEARSTLDLAVYDFRLDSEPAELLLNALSERAKAGVLIRIAYDRPPPMPRTAIRIRRHSAQAQNRRRRHRS